MKKRDITKQLARSARLTQAEAADEVDRVVSELVRRVRKGQSVSLPGFGTFAPDKDAEFPLERWVKSLNKGHS
ncbi:MAG TPA: HU family DNA-binding protein [Bryobacteraceae bacterium]|nr:HU family DNA-binding protein [Bryobacteraceae bacterium]